VCAVVGAILGIANYHFFYQRGHLMWRNVCIVVAAIFLFFAAVSGHLTVGDRHIILLYMGLMFWALSFLETPVLSRRKR
jgi:hypothetical protein